METIRLNPIEKMVQNGVNPLVAFLTNATCGEACWQAREDVCRCSCGGKNHGCLKSETGKRPVRTSKIDGYMYELKAFGSYNDLYSQTNSINHNSPLKYRPYVSSGEPLSYDYTETQKGAPARLKTASYGQMQKWEEFNSFHGLDRRQIWQKNGHTQVYCLWVRQVVES